MNPLNFTIIFIIVPFGLLWIWYPIYNGINIISVPIEIEEFIGPNILNRAIVDISLVIPAYNEETRLPIMLNSTLDYLAKWSSRRQKNFELIIVDDGSTDNTVEIVRSYNQWYSDKVFLLKLARNLGKGGAIKYGVQCARGDYILMADADGATDIEELDRLYTSLSNIEVMSTVFNDSIGLSIGSRAHLEKKSIASRAFYRTVLMKGFHLLVSVLCTDKIRDTQCGFKMFTRRTAQFLFKNLHTMSWAFDIELIYLAQTTGIPMAEVDVNWREIEGSKLIRTKLDVITTSLTMARDIMCIRLAYLLRFWAFSL